MKFEKLIMRVIIRSAVVLAFVALLSFMEPTIANDIALGQMQNSDEAFAIMSAYNSFRQFSSITSFALIAWYIGMAARDVYIFIKEQ